MQARLSDAAALLLTRITRDDAVAVLAPADEIDQLRNRLRIASGVISDIVDVAATALDALTVISTGVPNDDADVVALVAEIRQARFDARKATP